MAAGAAPAAPAAGEALAALALILAFAVCWGLRRAWAATIGWLFVELADLFDKVSIPVGFKSVHPLGSVSAFLRTIDKNVQHALAVAALKSEAGAAWLFTQAWHNLLWAARETRLLAEAVEHALGVATVDEARKRTAQLKAWTGGQVRALEGHLGALERRERADQARLANGIDRLKARLEHALHQGIDAVGARVGSVAGTLAGVRVRVGRLEKTAKADAHRLGKLEKTLGATGAAALVGSALGVLGLGWLRCGNTTKAGKELCGFNPGLLEALLLDAALLGGSVSIVELAEACQEIVGFVAGELETLVDEFG